VINLQIISTKEKLATHINLTMYSEKRLY